MSKYDMIFERLNEKIEKGELTVEEARVINERAFEKFGKAEESVITESAEGEVVQEAGPITDLKKKIGKIKDEKPGEDDSTEKITSFVEKHYDDIEKASKICEKEPEEIKKTEIKFLISILVAFVGVFAAVPLTPAVPLAGIILGVISYLWITFGNIVNCIYLWLRISDDTTTMNDLRKIKRSLVAIKDKTKDKKINAKIKKIIDKISDAKTEMTLKVKKESASGEITLKDALIYCESILTEAEDAYKAAINGNDSVDAAEKKAKGLDAEMGDNPTKETRGNGAGAPDGGEVSRTDKVLGDDDAIDKAARKTDPDSEFGADSSIGKGLNVGGLQPDGGEVARTKLVINADKAVDAAEKKAKGLDAEMGDNPATESMMDRIADTKLRIYESFDEGLISEDDKNAMLACINQYL